ncbi:MAG: HAMP domain-containing sensor histidine kinase [Myxococcota bacterium]
MRVRTKLALGCVLAVIPMSLGMTFAVGQMRTLARQSAVAAEAQHRTVALSLKILGGIDQVVELRRKGAATEDADYVAKSRQTEAQVSAWVAALEDTGATAAEVTAMRKLADAWSGASPEIRPAREAVGRLLEASRAASSDHAAWAAARQREVERVALVVGLGALALSVLAIVVLVRAVQRPVAQLMAGTHAVAAGDFDFRARPLSDDELGAVTVAFNRMVDSLGELDRLKSELISKVSHELRSPLVAMMETTELMLEELPGPLTADQRRMLELQAGAGVRLMTMIRDLLDVSSLAAGGELRTEIADAVALTGEVVDQLTPLASERALHLTLATVPATAEIRCDPRRYQQVVQNLVDNALRHSPSGSVVHVGLRRTTADVAPSVLRLPDASEPYLLLSVEDEGPGVPEEDRERIFDMFVQGHRRTGGFGLGLAICRQTVTAHGGVVGVADSVLGGAAFHVALPYPRRHPSVPS